MKLGIPFRAVNPLLNEDEEKNKLLHLNSAPLMVAELLSKGKARSIVSQDGTVIAGDQLVDFNGEILGKPRDYAGAFLQLQKLRGKIHQLITAVTIKTTNAEFHLNHITTLKMKDLSSTEIENYLKKDEPYDCAGSYKIEKSGLVLFSQINTDDFSAIQGLPLLWISEKLKELGYEFFQN